MPEPCFTLYSDLFLSLQHYVSYRSMMSPGLSKNYRNVANCASYHPESVENRRLKSKEEMVGKAKYEQK